MFCNLPFDIGTHVTFSKQFEKYQEQGQLLDTELENIVSLLLGLVKPVLFASTSLATPSSYLRLAIFKILYTLSKVRGYKTLRLYTTYFIHSFVQLFCSQTIFS